MRDDEGSTNQVYAATLSEEQEPRSRNRIAAALAVAVGWLFERLNNPTQDGEEPPIPQEVKPILQGVTELVASAYEGRAIAASLEGQLREAQIQKTYAEKRKLNAEASEIEQRTAWEREKRALERLEDAIEAAELLGGAGNVARLPDGRCVILLGEGLAERPPDRMDDVVDESLREEPEEDD